MSPDIAQLLKKSTPEPERGPDLDFVAKRARYLMWRQALLAGLLTICVAVSAFLVVDRWPLILSGANKAQPPSGRHDIDRIEPPGPEVHIPETPKEAPLPKDFYSKHVSARTREKLPSGPAYVIAEGRFDEGDWRKLESRSWRYIAWGNKTTHCSSFAANGWGCGTDNKRSTADVFSNRVYIPGRDSSIAYGEVLPDVAFLQFRLPNGDLIEVETIPPPAPLLVDVEYYFVFLPPTNNGEIWALDEEGQLLQKEALP